MIETTSLSWKEKRTNGTEGPHSGFSHTPSTFRPAPATRQAGPTVDHSRFSKPAAPLLTSAKTWSQPKQGSREAGKLKLYEQVAKHGIRVRVKAPGICAADYHCSTNPYTFLNTKNSPPAQQSSCLPHADARQDGG
jgi:hypothetical protein